MIVFVAFNALHYLSKLFMVTDIKFSLMEMISSTLPLDLL